MLRSRRMDLAHVPHRHPVRARTAFPAHHPLAHAGEQVAAADRCLLLAVAFTTAGTAVLAVTRRDIATAFVLAGSAVSGIAGVVAVVARQVLAAVAVATIAAGDDHAGVAELDDARRRLADRRLRAGLARSLTLYAGRRGLPGMRPGVIVMTSPASDEAADAMVALARQLVAEPSPPARVVALCTCLLTDGQTSPLFHRDPVQLDQELRRIRYLTLAEARDRAGGTEAYPGSGPADAFDSAPKR